MKKINENLIQIVKMLNTGEVQDGTSLGNQLKITRTAVWKMIQKLESYQIEINSMKGKGYALNEPLILLEPRKIKKLLKAKNVQLEIFESITSTNDYLKSIKNNSNKIKVCMAESQSQGRGRFNRDWHSPFGQNIYLSLSYPFQQDISTLAGLSIVVGLSICRSLDELYQLPKATQIKWPNDIIYGDKKLGGSLIEIQAESHANCIVIIGMGINVNAIHDKTKKINQPWTSIRKIKPEYYDRNILCARLIDNLLLDITKFSTQGLMAFMNEWQQRDYLVNKDLVVHSGSEQFYGKGCGINASGCLLLQINETMLQLSSGDTSIRKSIPEYRANSMEVIE